MNIALPKTKQVINTKCWAAQIQQYLDELYFTSSLQMTIEIALLILMYVLSTTTYWNAGQFQILPSL